MQVSLAGFFRGCRVYNKVDSCADGSRDELWAADSEEESDDSVVLTPLGQGGAASFRLGGAEEELGEEGGIWGFSELP